MAPDHELPDNVTPFPGTPVEPAQGTPQAPPEAPAAPPAKAEDESVIFRMMLANDVAKERLLLWRVAVVMQGIILLVLMRLLLVPWDVPWR